MILPFILTVHHASCHRPIVQIHTGGFLQSSSFLIKFSSLSAPTKIAELTAGSDEKIQRSPAGNRTQGLALSG